MSTATNTVPTVTACPTWCTLPDGHIWTDRSEFEVGDWIRIHKHPIDRHIGLRQTEVHTLSGEVVTDELMIDTENDVIEVGDAIELIDQLQKQVDALKVAVTLVQSVDSSVSA